MYLELARPLVRSILDHSDDLNLVWALLRFHRKGPGVDKWSGYLDAYHQHFNKFRSQAKVVMVEVGVQSGGSIRSVRGRRFGSIGLVSG